MRKCPGLVRANHRHGPERLRRGKLADEDVPPHHRGAALGERDVHAQGDAFWDGGHRQRRGDEDHVVPRRALLPAIGIRRIPEYPNREDESADNDRAVADRDAKTLQGGLERSLIRAGVGKAEALVLLLGHLQAMSGR